MGAPWEDYQSSGAAVADGPWSDYAQRKTPGAIQDVTDQAEGQQAIENTPPPPSILRNAAEAGIETVGGFIPHSVTQAGALLTPVVGTIEDLTKSVRMIKDWVHGATFDEADRKHFPEHYILADAEKTPAGSKERFVAGFNIVAQMLMAHGITTHLAYKAAGDVINSPKEVSKPKGGVKNEQTQTETAQAEETQPGAEAQGSGAAAEAEGAASEPQGARGPGEESQGPEGEQAQGAEAGEQAGATAGGPGIPPTGREQAAASGPAVGASGAGSGLTDVPLLSEDTSTAPGIDPMTGQPAGRVWPEVPTSQIVSRPDLMQFKQIDDGVTGTNKGDEITAPYDPLKAGNLLLWEPNNPAQYGLKPGEKYIVANGHHRHSKAVADEIKTQSAQILRESAGFTAADARTIAAEANIADGKGTIYDQAKFLRNYATTHGPNAALARAGQIGAKGRKAATIALAAQPDLYASFINEQITPDAAAAIANVAPGDAGLQRVGIERALKGDDPQGIANFIQAMRIKTGAAPSADQVDLFGNDDAAIRQAEAMAKRAGAIQKEISETINSVRGAAKRPEKAAALGVDVKDPQGLQKRIGELQALQARARNWAGDDQIRGLTQQDEIKPAEAVRQLSSSTETPATPAAEAPPIGEASATTEMPSPRPDAAGADFNFEAPESPEEQAARLKREEQAHAASEDLKDKQAQVEHGWEQKKTGTTGDLGQGDMFGGGDLFASPKVPKLGDEIARPAAGAPLDPADDPTFTALPVDLPEAVRFNNELLGIAISVKKKLRALAGEAAGIFRHTEGGPGRPEPRAEIHLRADIADLLSDQEKEELRTQAEEYAARQTDDPKQQAAIAKDYYEYLLDEAYQEAKTKPPIQALKVIWHEIGHAVDWFQHAAEVEGVTFKGIRGRGNLFGHVAALHDYLKGVIGLDPDRPAGKAVSFREREKLRKLAEKQLRDELGPIADIIETITVEEPILRIAGITPDDVRNLFGMDARETMPELYRWFAEQSAAVKKEIVRKAVRGVLDERLKALGKTEQIGTRTVEKTVHRKVGREPTVAEIQDRFRKLFREELVRRNLAEIKQVRAELAGAIAWWHGHEKMHPYFSSAEEMYAESFSIFMNNPAALAKRAPTYTRLLWNYLDHRPEVAAIYDKLQNEIKNGMVEDRTEAAMLDSWDKADAESLAEARRPRTTFRDFLDNVVYHVDRRMGPIYRAAKGSPLEPRVRAAIGNFLYRASEHELMLGRLNRNVGEPLVRANLDWKDLGRYMFYKRVAEERFKIFNPYGFAPDRALKGLAKMQQTMGPQRWAALERAHQAFRQLYEEHVVRPMKAERMWNEDLQRAIDSNIYYATFDVRRTPAGPDGIARMMQANFGNLGAHIYKQIGTVKEIKNPATATVLKSLSLISATARNAAKRETVMMLRQADPAGIMEARKRWTGKTWEYIPQENNQVGTVVFMRDGKPQAFYVRKVVSDALNNGNPIQNRLTGLMVNATGKLKGLFTQLNYAFWPVNFVRDTFGWVMQLPGATPAAWAREFPRALKAAYDVTKGKANRYAEDALRRRMLISRADPQGTWSAADNEYEVKLASYGLNPAQWTKEAEGVHGIVRAWNSYRELGQVIERVNKIGGMNYLDREFPKMPEWQKQEIVRERAGSPDFLQRGASNPYIDFFMMFYNPWKEGVRSVIKAGRDNPWSFAAKTTALVAAPSVMQVLANAGAFGSDRRKMYRSVPDYDLSNYLVIPLGWADKNAGKVTYLRLPLWEPARILHGAIWQMATGRGEGLLSIYGGTLPSMNAMLNVARMWTEYEVFGHNPYDSFRGKAVLNDTTFAAGGAAAREELLKYSWNSLGGSLFHRFQNEQLDSPPTTNMEQFLRLPIINNAVNRWVKVSNKGLADQDRHATADLLKQQASTRLAVQEIIGKVVNRQGLTPPEKLLMRDPYAMQYFMHTFPEHAAARMAPDLRRLQNKSTQEKALILQGMMQNQ